MASFINKIKLSNKLAGLQKLINTDEFLLTFVSSDVLGYSFSTTAPADYQLVVDTIKNSYKYIIADSSLEEKLHVTGGYLFPLTGDMWVRLLIDNGNPLGIILYLNDSTYRIVLQEHQQNISVNRISGPGLIREAAAIKANLALN